MKTLTKFRVRTADENDLGTLLMSLHHEFGAVRFLPASERTPTLHTDYLRRQIAKPDAVSLLD